MAMAEGEVRIISSPLRNDGPGCTAGRQILIAQAAILLPLSGTVMQNDSDRKVHTVLRKADSILVNYLERLKLGHFS